VARRRCSPAAWEAAKIRDVVGSTAGPYLAQYRTVPVRLLLDPEDVFYDLGLGALYDEAMDELDRREIAVDEGGDVTEAGEAELDAVQAARDAVEALRMADLGAFVASYTVAAVAAGVARGLTVPVEVQRVNVDAGPVPFDGLAEDLHAAALDQVVLPSGLPLSGYPSGRTPGDVDREAGRTYLARISQ